MKLKIKIISLNIDQINWIENNFFNKILSKVDLK